MDIFLRLPYLFSIAIVSTKAIANANLIFGIVFVLQHCLICIAFVKTVVCANLRYIVGINPAMRLYGILEGAPGDSGLKGCFGSLR